MPFRIFLASPGDVGKERASVREVVERLRGEPRFRESINLQVIAWDQPGVGVALDAAVTPQMAIERGLPKPSECDLVVVIAWSRIGTPLPDEYRKPDDSRYASGTEYEFLDALEARRTGTSPALWVYRGRADPMLSQHDPDFDAKRKQFKALEAFFSRLTAEDGASVGGVNEYETPIEFESQFAEHLRAELERWLDTTSSEVPSNAFGVINRAYYHKEAAELDRSDQWMALREMVQSSDDAVVLLHGEQRQNLEYFVARLWHHLAYVSEGHNQLVEVESRVLGSTPRSTAEWQNRLNDALGGGRTRGGRTRRAAAPGSGVAGVMPPAGQPG